MSSSVTLARPYARAAFEIAQSRNALGEWAARLVFAAEVASDPRVSALFADPRATNGQLASVVMPEGEGSDTEFARFVQVLADNGRLPVLPDIATLFLELKNEAERVLQVHVRSATPFDAGEISKLKSALKRRFNREIEIEQSIDRNILGGAVIHAGDVVIDGSVRGRLSRLRQALVA